MNNTILALFQTLNVLSMMIETFAIVAVRITITSIVLGQYFIEGCKVVYNNRQEIMENANNIRNAVGYKFAYAGWVTVHYPLRFRVWGVIVLSSSKNAMDFDTFDTDVWAEINDMPGEIYDIEEEKFDVQEYINGNTDYWSWLTILLNVNNSCTTLNALWNRTFSLNGVVNMVM